LLFLAYKELSLHHHPDKFSKSYEKKQAHLKFIEIEVAYRYFVDINDEHTILEQMQNENP